MLIADGVGHILQWTHSYVVPFLIAGSAYLVALLVLHMLAPQLQPVNIASAEE
jgi:ACS family hexuronate transporter-like MFS transporter